MNSDEEKALFEEWGWEYNFIMRSWTSPGGRVAIKLDDLVDAGKSRMGEEQLKQAVMAFGKKVD